MEICKIIWMNVPVVFSANANKLNCISLSTLHFNSVLELMHTNLNKGLS